MRTAGSLYSRTSWVLVCVFMVAANSTWWTPVQEELLAVCRCDKQYQGFCVHPWVSYSSQKVINDREWCKSCYTGNCGAAQRVKGVGLAACGEQTFFLWCVHSSLWVAGQFLGVLNVYCLEMSFSFTSQCKPCLKNENSLCLEVRLKCLFLVTRNY